MAATRRIPRIPAALDDALFNALRGIVGTDLAFACVDAAWEAFSEYQAQPIRSHLGWQPDHRAYDAEAGR